MPIENDLFLAFSRPGYDGPAGFAAALPPYSFESHDEFSESDSSGNVSTECKSRNRQPPPVEEIWRQLASLVTRNRW